MAILLTGTTIGGHSAIHAGNLATHGIITTSNIGSYAITSIPTNFSSITVTSSFDTASNDVYASMRVIRNNSSTYQDGMYIGYGNSGSGPTRIFGGGYTSGELIKYATYTYEPGSFRAPIFYDSADTGYYLDPNSTSYLYHLVLSGNNYFRPNTWIQFDGSYGLYWPNNYALHIYPNANGSHGALQINGTKGGWAGIYFNDSANTLMANSNESGFHRQGNGWQFRWTEGTMYVHRSTSGGGTAYTVLDTGNYNSFGIPTKQYIWSRGENLLTNGTGLLGNNTNFSSFTFDGSQAYSSSGSFRYTGQYHAPNTDELMPVNAEKRYRLDFWAKTANGQGAYYAYLNFFDVDGNAIVAPYHMYYPNTLTTLAQTLNPGDTVAYLTSVANWENGGTAGVNTHLRSFIFWNYTNSFGYTYPPQTYSRNWYPDAWNPGAINSGNNTITLRVPWSGPSIPAGTQVSNGSAGGTYKYIALAYTIVPTTWTNYVGIMDGIDYSGSNAGGKFPPGTAAAKLGFLTDYNASGDTIYLANLFVGVDNDYPIYDRWTGNTRINKSGAFYGTIFYDSNNDGYYLDPNSTSNLYRVDAAAQMRAPIFYDSQDTNYYLDPNSTSRLGTLNINQLSVYGNTYLGDGNGDEVHINDILRVGATDSGDAHFYFGEGSLAGSDYGMHWYWDSGVNFYWYGRNAGSDTLIMNYTTNDNTYVKWHRHFHMNNYEINYTGQLHFNGNTRFVNNGANYLNFQIGSDSYGSIQVRDNSNSIRGYLGYFDGSGFGLLNSSGSWGIRLNPGNVGTELFYAGDWRVQTVSGGTRVNGNLYTNTNYGFGLVGLYSSYRYQGVFAMSDDYKLSDDGTSTGNLYGIAWTHTNVGGESKSGLGHQALFMTNGNTQTAIGTGIWTNGLITTTSYGTSANWKAAYDWGNHATAGYLTGAHNHDDRYYTESEIDSQISNRLYQARVNGLNVNAFNATGLYRGSTGDWSNRPTITDNSGALLTIDTHPGDYHTQLFFDSSGTRLYLRSAIAGSWGSWVTMWHSGNLTNLNQLTNGPGYITSSALSSYIPYGNWSQSTGLNDNKLYLRTNGDNNHYLWNASDDWEELNAYEGTGFRVTSVGGTVGLLYVHGSSNGGYTYSPYSFRAPIFYDSNDTNYYVDPNGTSVLNYLTLNAAESMGVYGIRGKFTNEYIHLYNKVGIGHPGGWGEGQGNTPGYGLSTYGGATIAYGNSAGMTVYGNITTDSYVLANYNVRVGEIWGQAGLYRSSGHMMFGTEGGHWYFQSSNNTRVQISQSDGNIWMGWANDWLSNLLSAKQNASTAITTSNIGSQSVSYATTAGSLSSMNISQFTNNSGYLTGITSGQVTGALGYTPYNSSNPSGYITSSGSISGNAATATYATTAGSAPNGSNINQFYNVSAGVGNGLSFWNGSSAYKISMGVGSLYQYGPVSDYSIKMQMNDGDTGRGFTWGRESYAPIAALNSTSGDMEVAGYFKSYGYRGNGNVGGTGTASWHPDGIYCGSTMWQYGTMYKNNTGIYDVSEFKLNAGPVLGTYNTRNLIVKAHDSNDVMGILGQKSGGGFAFQIYGDGTNYGFLDGSWAGWDIKKTVDGAMYMNDDNSYYLYTNSESRFNTFTTAGSVVIGGTFANNPYNAVGSTRLLFGGGNEPNNYFIGTNMENYGGNYTKLDLRWHTGIRMGAQPGYGGIRFFNNETLGSRIMSIGEGDANIRIDNNLWIGGAGGWITDLLNAKQNASTAITTSNIGSQSVSYASSAGSVAWTNVSSRPTALSQFSNDLGNYGGWITSSGSISGNAATATNVAWSGVTSKPAAWLDGGAMVQSMEPSATAFPSGFYESYLGAGNPTGTWFNYINVRHSNTGNGHGFQLGMSYYDTNLWFRSYQGGTSPSFSAWNYAIHSGNIGSQSVNYANSAGSATSATNAGQLNTYGYLVGENWNDYYTSGKLRVASVAGSTSANCPPNVHNYGGLLSYGIAGEDSFQLYFPDNAADSIANSRKLTYRTGRNGGWSSWRTVVDMVGDTLTIVEGPNPKIVVRGSAGYGSPSSASIELVGDADGGFTQSYRWISNASDWAGQEFRLERKVNNSFQLVGRVPKNTNNLEWQGTIVQGLSDSRVKSNVVSMTGGLDKIDQIRPVTFDWVPTENVSDREGADFGFIAQELEEVLPEVVHTRGDGYKTVMYEKVVPVLVQAMKEQQAMIDALKAEIELLKNK